MVCVRGGSAGTLLRDVAVFINTQLLAVCCAHAFNSLSPVDSSRGAR